MSNTEVLYDWQFKKEKNKNLETFKRVRESERYKVFPYLDKRVMKLLNLYQKMIDIKYLIFLNIKI